MTASASRTTVAAPHRLLLPGLVFACLVSAVVSSLGAPLVPAIAEAAHISLTTAQWSLTITLLAGAVATPTMGRLGDGPRRREVIVVSLALVAIGCVLAALPLGFGPFLVGRALQGVGLGLTPLAIATARDALPLERARPAVALLSITTVAGVGLGYPVTGLIAAAGGVHVAYWFGALMGAAALLGAWRVVPPSAHRPRLPLDVVGAVLLAVALASLLLGISMGEIWGWGSVRVIGLVAAAMVLLAGWVLHELRTAHPLVALRLVRDRTVLTADLAALLAGVGMYLLISLVVRYTQTPTSTGYGLGATVVISGLALVPFSIGSYLAARLTPALARRTSHAAILPIASVTLLAGMVMFSFARTDMWQLLVMMAVVGLGVGAIFAVVPGLLMRSVPANETASAMGFNQVLRYIGYSIGSALAAVILEAHTSAGQSYPSSDAYTVAGLVTCGMWILTAVVTSLVPLRRRGAGGRRPQVADEELLAEESVAGALPYDEPTDSTDLAGSADPTNARTGR